MSKFLVTGGAGFIGGNFLHMMTAQYPDDEYVCLDALTYAGNMETLAPIMGRENFRFVHENICNREAVFALFGQEHFDYVINFAAESHVDRSISDPEIFLKTNVFGTQVLLDACRTYGIRRYHQVSTDEVYGDLPLDRPDLFFTEETPIRTSSPFRSSVSAVPSPKARRKPSPKKVCSVPSRVPSPPPPPARPPPSSSATLRQSSSGPNRKNRIDNRWFYSF